MVYVNGKKIFVSSSADVARMVNLPKHIETMFENAHFINMAFDSSVPYNDLPALPPNVELEDTTVLKACIQARVALAELKQICLHFPSPVLLQTVFPLLEAQGSCALESGSVPLEDLLKLPPSLSPTSGAKGDVNSPVLAVRRALALGYELTQETALNVSIMQELCSTIELSPMPVRRVAARVCSRDKVEYTPPVGSELIQSLLGNWQRFIHVDAGNLDPLVLLAVAHYQLQAIQPFSAGNGKIARLVDYMLLHEEGLLHTPVLNLSAWFYRNQHEYRRLQMGVTQDQQWQPWLLFVLRGVCAASEDASRRLQAISDLKKHTDSYVSSKLPKLHSAALLEVLFSDPCVRIHNLVERNIARRQTASVYLKKLCQIGVLNEIAYGKEKLFIHQKLMALVTSTDPAYSKYTI